ncbi:MULTISPECIES: hypothetical protein [unclassified Streptomyces]|uniref:DUF3137 domain-containing protein n=1 Tax=Streptomyces sp. NBC_00119 TaxID=2975659 RepID=A0AAU1U7M3_9ACTN|nr:MULTISPECIES: hypothetical protein [unclassified Streptomyces]MCX4642797.1 hypothetical protein [Streptomyces sp. NBC_01446]MCX5323922.1 hypothetical protein [Streptomyces sp. NBC_00120]
MEMLIEILVNVLLAALIAGVIKFAFKSISRSAREDERLRRDWADFIEAAPARDWTYERRAPGRATEYCGVGPMPGKGSNLTAWHYTTGEFRGRSFKCFEYRYTNPLDATTEGGNRKLTYESVFLVSAPGSGAYLHIGRPGKFDRMLGRGPRKLIDVPEFDEKFRVDRRDEDFVRNILTDDVRAFLLSDPRGEKNPLRVRDDELFTWYTGILTPRNIEDRLNYLCDVLDRIPENAWASA